MTSWGPPELVDGPIPQPPWRSLVNSVELNPSAGERWLNGVALRPFSGQCASTYDYCGATPAAMDDGTAGTPSGSAADLEFGSFMVYLPTTCTTRGLDIPEFKRRASQVLTAVEPAAVEKEFESGAALATPNRFLRDSHVTLLDGDFSHNVVDGFARLELAIAATCRRGMIHCPVGVATAAKHAMLLETDPTNSQRLITAMGTIVVPGQGYTGAAPVGGTVGPDSRWAYATGMVELRRSAGVETLPPDDALEALNRTTNQITYRAYRYWNIAWDGALQAAIKIDRSTPTP